MLKITKEPISIADLRKDMEEPRAGAFVDFEGLVRNHNEGSGVKALEYECFETLALSEGDKIIAEAKDKFKVYDIHCVHRTGYMGIGDLAVWVGVTSAHRNAAFQACRYVIDELKIRLPIWKKEHYLDGKSEWVNCQQCAKHGHTHTDSDQQKKYYSRQTSLSKVGDKGQDRLSKARVLVVGAGGLGSPALMNLAAAGIGKIGICDGDRLDISNLHRQTIFLMEDVGEFKADRAKTHLENRNPYVEVISHVENLDLENAERITSGYDIVLDCTDNFKTKFLLHDVCYFSKKPLVQASIYQFEGQVQVFNWESDSGCMRCLWPDIPDESCVGSCAEVGVLGVVPNVLGSLQASETVKLILGVGELSDSQTVYVDLLTNDINKITRRPDKDCPLCGESPKIKTLDSENYSTNTAYDWEVSIPAGKDQNNFNQYEWIDIRPEEDWLNGNWPDEVKNSAIRELRKGRGFLPDRNYLISCERGIRSRQFVASMREQGFDNLFSLKGGLSAENFSADV